MADESPATKQDIQDLKAAVGQDIQDLKAAMGQNVQDLKAAMEKVETTLLSEFWKWARTNDVKIRSVTSRSNDFDERLLLIEERVSELERKRKAS
ncbi:MAG: hypothetical protein ABSH47_06555 [Bryobacteraceae bacterium]